MTIYVPLIIPYIALGIIIWIALGVFLTVLLMTIEPGIAMGTTRQDRNAMILKGPLMIWDIMVFLYHRWKAQR